jgi:hypothetical protein
MRNSAVFAVLGPRAPPELARSGDCGVAGAAVSGQPMGSGVDRGAPAAGLLDVGPHAELVDQLDDQVEIQVQAAHATTPLRERCQFGCSLQVRTAASVRCGRFRDSTSATTRARPIAASWCRGPVVS